MTPILEFMALELWLSLLLSLLGSQDVLGMEGRNMLF